jgi:hypothetical protein
MACAVSGNWIVSPVGCLGRNDEFASPRLNASDRCIELSVEVLYAARPDRTGIRSAPQRTQRDHHRDHKGTTGSRCRRVSGCCAGGGEPHALLYPCPCCGGRMIIIEIFERGCTPRFQIGSTAHDRHRPVTTLQCCSRLPLLVDRWRVCSANAHRHAPAHSNGDGNHNAFVASPRPATTLSRNRPHLAVTRSIMG